MALVILSRAHHAAAPGACAIGSSLSEYEISETVNDSAAAELILQGHRVHRIEGVLADKIDEVNDAAARSVEYTIAVETHCNWSDSPNRVGAYCMAYYTSRDGVALGRDICDELTRSGVGVDPYVASLCSSEAQWIGTPREYANSRQAFVCNTKPPAVIVEMGFLSNQGFADWIRERKNRAAIGSAIGRGIGRYLWRRSRDESV